MEIGTILSVNKGDFEMMTREQALDNLKFADHLEFVVEDEQFNMEKWCGTACCVAGHYARWNPKISVLRDFWQDQCAVEMGLWSRQDSDDFERPDEYDELFIWSGLEHEPIQLVDVTRKMAADRIRTIVRRYHPDLIL